MKYFTLIIIVVLVFSISGCSMGERNNNSQPNEADFESTISVKPTPPINFKTNFQKTQYTKEEDVKLDIQFDIWDKNAKTAKAVIESNGIVHIKGNMEYDYSNIQDLTNYTVPIEFLKPYSNGYGEVNVWVYAYSESGELLYGRRWSVYYNITDEEILLGSNGIDELRKKHLDNKLTNGEISKREHKELLDELYREGVKITTKTIIQGEEQIEE